jgi:hypothetical protein
MARGGPDLIQASPCGICGGHTDTGIRYSPNTSFSRAIFFPPILHCDAALIYNWTLLNFSSWSVSIKQPLLHVLYIDINVSDIDTEFHLDWRCLINHVHNRQVFVIFYDLY